MSDDYTRDDIVPKRPVSTEPWWNSADKVSGLAATVIMLVALALIIAGTVKLITIMF